MEAAGFKNGQLNAINVFWLILPSIVLFSIYMPISNAMIFNNNKDVSSIALFCVEQSVLYCCSLGNSLAIDGRKRVSARS